MAPRRPRSNNHKPDRSRSRVRVPGIAPMSLSRPSGLTYEQVLIRGEDRVEPKPNLSRAIPGGASTPAQAAAARNMSQQTLDAMELARNGDDSILLPYQPTPSINPPRPRTLAAGYDSKARVLRIRFRDGTPWEYYDVPPNVWQNFKKVKSPGRFVNRVLNNYEYSRGDF